MPRPGARRGAAEPVEGEALITTGSARLERDPDAPGGWFVHVNGVPSSYVDVADPTNLVFEYQQWTAVVLDELSDPPHPLRAVHLGGAGCAFPRYLAATRPGSRQLVLEVDERLADLVRRSFGASGPAGFKLKVADARAGLARVPDGTQDAVVRDAFSGDRVPAHLVSVEFLRDVERVLAPGGVWIANLADRPPLPHSRAEAVTARAVFAHVAVLAEPSVLRGRRYGNTLLVASRAPLPVDRLVRVLSGGAAPARLLAGEDLDRFAAGSTVVTDAALGLEPPAAPRTPTDPTTDPTTEQEPDS
ncbi:spermidine synthase [Kineococcus sp. SYSU DK004]|uniref:spermidine synthase n=1 Tax=Kineococcus sp. SYSU DK004 TaxID=3383125 RepID=UPI003D7D3839